jgi:pimeloyl-ACP methyl ester carboxylesterase
MGVAARGRSQGVFIPGQALAALAILVALAGLAPAVSAPLRQRIVDLPVTFRVRNINRSKVSCQSDGKSYSLRGHLVAPAGALGKRSRPVALYVHGYTHGESTWRQVPHSALDFPYQLARLGHASVSIDQLGYGASGKPNGNQVCLGSEADMVHQVIGSLRSGHYQVSGPLPAPSFRRVVMVGFSNGGTVAQTEAYSFLDVEALVVGGWTELFLASPVSIQAAPRVGPVCARGGEPVEPGGPSGYAFTWPSAEAEANDVFYDPAPGARERLAKVRQPDPCGVGTSYLTAASVSPREIGTINVPVLLVFGSRDKVQPRPFGDAQLLLYTGTQDKRLVYIDEAGHSLMAEKRFRTFQLLISGWLRLHGA